MFVSQAVTPTRLKYKNHRTVRRGDRFKICYEGIVVDLFVQGTPKILVYWILIHPETGARIEPDFVLSEELRVKYNCDGPDSENLQVMDAAHFLEYAEPLT